MPTSPNGLLYVGMRELRRTEVLKAMLNTVSSRRDSRVASSRTATGKSVFPYDRFASDFSSQSSLSDSEASMDPSLLFSVDDGFPPNVGDGSESSFTDSAASVETARRSALEEALRRQPDEAGISVDDALSFVDGICRRTAPQAPPRSRNSRGRLPRVRP
jgi:hypothetical protein